MATNYGKAKTGEGHAPGGVGSALDKNPNEEPNLNDAPDGPFAHGLGMTDDGGVHGNKTAKFRGNTFYFK